MVEQAETTRAYSTAADIYTWKKTNATLSVDEVTDANTGTCAYEVPRLITDKVMFFRVAAENKQGVGEFEATKEPIKIASPHGE